MPVSKLESLPNEILWDILEKYVNGVDVINAFAFQLNRRFDALIMKSRRLRFDFMRCRKDDFRVCMGILPAYFDKIEELTLAEQYTPGQVHAFLSFYPSFTMFKNLRKIYLQVDMKTVESVVFSDALRSLLKIDLHTLSLNVSSVRETYTLGVTIREIFNIKTLKKLSIDGSFIVMSWNLLKEGSSNIEYLTIHGDSCSCMDLQYIFRCAPGLRYLNINMSEFLYTLSSEFNSTSFNALLCMSMLHTAIFDVQHVDKKMLNILETYFKCMPSLKQLELKVKNYDGDVCECALFIYTTLVLLPLLTSFILCITSPRIADENVSYILALAENPVWVQDKHINLIIKYVSQSAEQLFEMKASNKQAKEPWSDVVFRWNTNLSHTMSDNPSILNTISKFYLSSQSHSLLQNYYLNNVTHLFIYDLDDHLLTDITTHINCSRVQYLDVTSITGNALILPTLETLTNVRSLRINFKQLHHDLSHYSRTYENVQSLDLSVDLHTFSEEDIFMISKTFPRLEHLIIYAKGLRNAPMLGTYLPRLRSFTFCPAQWDDVLQFDPHGDESFIGFFRRKTKFFFQQNGDWITIWIDRAVLRDSYWRKIGVTNHSKNFRKDSFMGRTIKKISSLFK